MRALLSLHAAIASVCPIDGVSRDGRIDYAQRATAEQRAAALGVFAGFDFSDAAQAVREAQSIPERKDLRDQAAQAIADNDTYLALASPSNAQVSAQVRRLTQQNKRLIARLIQVD